MTQITKSVLLCSIALASCGIKLKGTKHGDNSKVERFLVGNGVTQYFVKPLSFSCGQEKILIDFTVRGKNDSGFNARINFTISGSDIAKVDSYHVVNTVTNAIVLSSRNVTTTTVTKGRRFFSEVSNSKLFAQLVSGEQMQIMLFSGPGAQLVSNTFTPGAKTTKVLRTIPAALRED